MERRTLRRSRRLGRGEVERTLQRRGTFYTEIVPPGGMELRNERELIGELQDKMFFCREVAVKLMSITVESATDEVSRIMKDVIDPTVIPILLKKRKSGTLTGMENNFLEAQRQLNDATNNRDVINLDIQKLSYIPKIFRPYIAEWDELFDLMVNGDDKSRLEMIDSVDSDISIEAFIDRAPIFKPSCRAEMKDLLRDLREGISHTKESMREIKRRAESFALQPVSETTRQRISSFHGSGPYSAMPRVRK